MAKAKLTEIVGLVSMDGGWGDMDMMKRTWTLRFSFDCWRRSGGKIEGGKLEIEQPGFSEKRSGKAIDAIEALAILRVRSRLPGGGKPATLTKVIDFKARDAELAARRKEPEKPVNRKDPFFGKLTLNRVLDWYETTRTWKGRKVHVYLSRAKGTDEPAFFRKADKLWKDQAKLDRSIRDQAVRDLLELKNDTWRDDDENKVSAAGFRRRMKLESITISPDGRFDFTFNDDDLFWGHVIQVFGTIAKGPSRADIAG